MSSSAAWPTRCCVISTSTEGIAPADKKIYALRDVTGTVESLPLITASIMSKKLAMGASSLILDVKTGSGAFMRIYQDSKALAQSLIAAAAGSGTQVEALITDMDRPLGIAAGNANEIIETIEVLKGNGPADVEEVTRAQAERVLVMSGRFDEDSANARARRGADVRTRARAGAQVDRRAGRQSGHRRRLLAARPAARGDRGARRRRAASSPHIDTYQAGMFTVDLGAGRKKADDVIDYAAGVMFDRNTGDEVKAGDVIARIQLGDAPTRRGGAARAVPGVRDDRGRAPAARPLVHEH